MARRVERDREAMEVVGRQPRRREETRTRLLEAARALTLERDVEAITIADITARADVGFGSFYHYFDSKEEATTEREAELLQATLEELLANEPDRVRRRASSLTETASKKSNATGGTNHGDACTRAIGGEVASRVGIATGALRGLHGSIHRRRLPAWSELRHVG
jgi:AcrR family transcriptional regulator